MGDIPFFAMRAERADLPWMGKRKDGYRLAADGDFCHFAIAV